MKVMALVLAALCLTSCRTPGSSRTTGYNPYAPLDVPPPPPQQQVDGVKYQDPGREVKVRNAFNAFRM